MGYAFVIDQRKCIGCHACTVACKSENEVPLGDFRTWVRYTEKGSYPAVKRHFTVLRCNHCDEAPCIEICPVNALHKRPDAIVDLDRDQCIGCKSCMQGCPYDALYLNDDRGVVEKCHFCAHRTELGMEPACVVVCPEQAIVAGDLDNPEAEITRLVRDEPSSQRRLDKGTKPRVWYLDALEESLEPGVAAEPEQWLWSDRQFPAPELAPNLAPPTDIITTLNNQSKVQWGWHVWLYLVTKNLAAGAMMLAPFAASAGLALSGWSGVLPEIIALVFLGITNVLLIDDLGRPERFWKILLQPNTKSWLVKGAWVLSAFGLLTTVSAGLRLLDMEAASDVVRWINLPVALLTASYSAFLFAQCRGRDLWIEPGLFWLLAMRASTFAAGLAIVLTTAPAALCSLAFGVFALINIAAIALETKRIRGNDHWEDRPKAMILHAFKTGPAMGLFGLGALLALGAALAAGTAFAWPCAMAALLAVTAGMTLYERSWITAGQVVPNS
jgi:Fe-S-cluster-containing dehydrogenase component